MRDDAPPLNKIIDAWKTSCGDVYLGEKGTPYVRIPSARMRESLQILRKTLVGYGYTYEEIDSVRVSMAIVDACWKENKIVKMSISEIKKAKKNLSDDWDEVIHDPEFSGIVIAKLDEDEKDVPVAKTEYKKPEKTKEEIMSEIFEPKDRIVPNKTVDKADNTNWELLAELGIEPDESKDE